MSEHPLAYFITFHTYGSWLHGQAPGLVDREHNVPGSPWIDPDPDQLRRNRDRMAQPPYLLDARRRTIVRDALVDLCRFRNWLLRALHVRTNHVHLVVSAPRDPEFVMRSCKAHASKCLTLAGFETADRKRWTTHGSTKYPWSEEAIAKAIAHTLDGQGERMAVYPDDAVS